MNILTLLGAIVPLVLAIVAGRHMSKLTDEDKSVGVPTTVFAMIMLVLYGSLMSYVIPDANGDFVSRLPLTAATIFGTAIWALAITYRRSRKWRMTRAFAAVATVVPVVLLVVWLLIKFL